MSTNTTDGKRSAEHLVKYILRATRRHFSSEDRIKIVLDGVNAGVKSGQAAEQIQATIGARMRPLGGRSPSGGLMRARRFSEGVSAGLSGAALSETIAIAVHLQDIDVVCDAVEQCSGETLGSQGFGPFVKWKFAGIRVAPRS